MFFQRSNSRVVLSEYLRQYLPRLRDDNVDARILDEITISEILDLTYLDGATFDSCMAAHSLYPTYVEDIDRTTVPSTISVTFPVHAEADSLALRLALKCWRPSELKIGQRGTAKVVNPKHSVPSEFLEARINNTDYQLQEPNGTRLRSLAGPLHFAECEVVVEINAPDGADKQLRILPGPIVLYGRTDENGHLRCERDSQRNIVPRTADPAKLRAFPTYLWTEARPVQVSIEAKWIRHSAERVLVTFTISNITPRGSRDEAKDIQLDSLVLPIVEISIQGGVAAFPPLQYAVAKRHFLQLVGERERLEEAQRRLYEVRQSGCIATAEPQHPERILLTTFGIFDTPREEAVGGPGIDQIASGPTEFLAKMPEHDQTIKQWINEKWESVRGVLKAAAQAFDIQNLRLFQWEGICQNIRFLAHGTPRKVTVVRAPTGAGKTIVFFVNAAISCICGPERSTSVLMFPTRLLNEDMFRRLTLFVSKLRITLPDVLFTGGILMGTSDPLYKLLLEPEINEPMHHYGPCPSCGASPMSAIALNGRIVPKCSKCNGAVDYMFNPREVGPYLPDIIIATPDKLLYEATASRTDRYTAGLFGAPVVKCNHCGRFCPQAFLQLKPEWRQCSAFYAYKSGCPEGTFQGPPQKKLIRYMGFDEVHSLYGQAATYLSMFLANLEILQGVLAGRREAPIRYETATATIANETELIEALTRRSAEQGNIVLVPADAVIHEYFRIRDASVRHRVVVTLPARVSSKEAFIRAVLNSYLHLHGSSPDLQTQIAPLSSRPQDWDFLLGYLFKKQEGNDMRRALRDMYLNAFGDTLNVEFLSGEAPKNQISELLRRALTGAVDILLANLVISLGIDIHGLNHMIMLGVPRGFTEYVQTAGRTGRGLSPGHVHIILQPFYPRDTYLYRHFHAILSDVPGYYDILPVRSTNLFCASEMFGNVAKSLITALCLNPSKPQWSHSRGIRTALQGMDGRLQGAIAGILCNDPALQADVRNMIDTRFQRLLDEISSSGGFLSETMHDSDGQWLIYSLRGRPGSSIRITCVDQPLLDRLRTPVPTVAEEEEPESENQDAE